MSPSRRPPAFVSAGASTPIVSDGDPPLLLGGVVVSDTLGVSATSDGDVLAHAVTDAVLGAAALLATSATTSRRMTRPTDGADSMMLLRQAVALAGSGGWVVGTRRRHGRDRGGAGVASSGGDPRLGSPMSSVSGSDAVSVKATTTDGLGFIGRGEGLAVVAVVTMASPS